MPSSFRFVLPLLSVCFASVSPAADIDVPKDIQPLLARYCITCHGDSKSQGKLNLETIQKEPGSVVWHEISVRLRRREMPPANKPQPSDAERARLIEWAKSIQDQTDAATPLTPGRVTMRRLNRIEYRNTIRDLVGISFDYSFDPTRDFPADGAGYGFDNIGDVLSLSPLHMEKYLGAARQILDRALVVDGVDGPRTWPFAAGDIRRVVAGEKDVGALAPCHWVVELNVRQPGDYVIRAEVRSDQDNKSNAQMAIQADGTSPSRFTFSRQQKASTVERKLTLARGRTQVWVAYEHEQDKKTFEPADVARGQVFVDRLVVSGPVNIEANQLPESHRRIVSARPNAEKSRRQAAEEVLRGLARRAFRRPVRDAEVERYVHLFELADRDGETFEGALLLPLQAILVSPHFLYRVEKDRDATAGAYDLGSFELASRLSYFLWSSMPDEELFRLATEEKLADSTVLAEQARRMVKDPKAAALADNFVTQWLQIRGLEHFQPAIKQSGTLGTDLRNAMMQEPILVFQEILREDRKIMELLDANYTYANAALAKHYGLPVAAENQGKETDARRMVRYPLPDGRRGGVLTMAAVLTVTSHPDRTSPVRRGKWMLESLLGAPPPPPPADVGELLTDAKTLATQTMRQRLEAHRAQATCAACHQRMDPLGFAFENYDVLGRWRDRDGKLPIDAAATLPDGRSFTGPVELKKLLREQQAEFARCLTEKLLTFALGRGLEPSDRRVVDRLTKTIADDDYRLSRLIVAIVGSEPFRQRARAKSQE